MVSSLLLLWEATLLWRTMKILELLSYGGLLNE
jgi:hypothetical protein